MAKTVKLNTLREWSVEITSELDFIFLKKDMFSPSETNGGDSHQSSVGNASVETDDDDLETYDDGYLLTRSERDEALKELRKKPDYYLIGPFSKERQQFVDHFITSLYSCHPTQFNQDLCLAFFNCLLDKSFTSFNLFTGEEMDPPFITMDIFKLLPVISQRCPDLKALGLIRDFPYFVSFKTLSKLLQGFNCLTSLTLIFPWTFNLQLDVDFRLL